MNMSKPTFSPKKLMELIELAGKSGVKSMSIAPDGSVSIEFGKKEENKNNNLVGNMEVAETIADEANKLEEREITEDLLLEAEITDPALIGKWIREGKISETDSGELVIN